LARRAAARGFATAAVNYRLTSRGNAPGRARYPACLQDTAAAVAWVHAHIGEYGGDPERVFIAGFSAGAYLAAMITLDRRWLTEAGMRPERLAGAAPISGQMYTHGTVRAERALAARSQDPQPNAPATPPTGENEEAAGAESAAPRRPVIDEAAPTAWSRGSCRRNPFLPRCWTTSRKSPANGPDAAASVRVAPKFVRPRTLAATGGRGRFVPRSAPRSDATNGRVYRTRNRRRYPHRNRAAPSAL